ncbi:unnamed protein product [Notodromas monacha]|uniref:Uncharacterized protein n=1 Tax=Notodromas monacha TaxID=399045 RepID=A0A7R9BPU7_9CRUS|nr:unnamed protein product [Notodromas monacha]CAG0918586.1 unnamed protein product [Notodromas monacha]
MVTFEMLYERGLTMGRLWKTSVLLILAILVLTKDDQHSLSSFAMTTSVHAAADSDSSIVGPDMLAYSGQHHHDSSARRRRFNAQPRLTLDEEDDFMALVEAELKFL